MAQLSAPPPSYVDATRQQAQGWDAQQQEVPQSYPTQPTQPPQEQYPFSQQSYPPASQGYQAGEESHYEPPAVDGDAENAFNARSFSDKAVRHSFIRKVYLILMLQLAVTAAMVAVFILVTPVKRWVQRNMWFYIMSYVTFLVTYIVLACCPGVRRKYPGNYIALAVFTLMFSYVCAAIASYHDAQAVLIAAGITVFVTLSISLFAVQTKIDFTMCHGLMFAAAMTLIFAGIAFMIVRFALPYDENYTRNRYILQCVYGSIAALILALFLVFDTQRIVGGKNRRYALSPEEHIIGAMELYLDIVYMFLIILSLFGGSDN